MIARVWRGYTKPENADAYEAMLKPELLPGVSQVPGYNSSCLLRREAGAEVEFINDHPLGFDRGHPRSHRAGS